MSHAPTAVFAVEGMSCAHCVSAVSEEVAEVDGVEDVAVDLPTGRLELRGHGFSDEAIREAVEEAGYRLAGRV